MIFPKLKCTLTITDPFSRFLMLPSILRAPHGPVRPLSPFFVLPELYSRHDHGLDYAATFRQELTLALSELLLVDDDAIFRSFFESRPLKDFKCQAKIDQAGKVYADGSSPYIDLFQCVQHCSPKWIAIAASLCWG